MESGIVGYQTIKLPVGYSLFTVTFKTPGKTTLDIKDIVLCNKDGVVMDDTDGETPLMRCRGDVFFQKINPATGLMTDAIYDYTTKNSTGWRLDGEPIEERGECVFKSGEAIYFKNDLENEDTEQFEEICLRVSGEVELTPYTMELIPGYSLIGNPTPVRVDLTTVKLCNANKVEMDDTAEETPLMRCRGDVFFQKINPATGLMTDAIYDYTTKNGIGWRLDGETVEEKTVYLEPGESVYFKNDLENEETGLQESVYLKFPSPVAK